MQESNVETVARAICEACHEAGYLVSIAERHELWIKLAYAAIGADDHES